MNEAKTKPRGTASNVFLGLVFSFGGAVWLALILFFAADSIGDYQEAHPREFSGAPPWTWHDTLQRMGGVSGVLLGFAPPSILLGYGLYLLYGAITVLSRRLTPDAQ